MINSQQSPPFSIDCLSLTSTGLSNAAWKNCLLNSTEH